MDNLVWIIYLMGLLTKSNPLLVFPLVVSFLLGSLLWVIDVVDEDTEVNLPYKKMVLIPSVCAAFSIFIPTEDTAYKMLAAYGVTELAENKQVQETMGDGLAILQLTLKEYREKLEKQARETQAAAE